MRGGSGVMALLIRVHVVALCRSDLCPLSFAAVHDQRLAISEKMHRMLVNHSNRFEVLREGFSVSKEEHSIIQEEVESRILRTAENFNAEISITGRV